MFARTNRLLLRPGWMEDAPALARAIGDEAVVRNLLHAPWPYRLEDAELFLSSFYDPAQPQFLIFSRTRGAPRLVGGCGIHGDGRGGRELGYWIARPFWGLGFATEAAQALMQVARASGVGPVLAAHFVDNPASGHVLRKIGFRPTGRVERRHSIGRGTDVDCLLFEQDEGRAMTRDSAIELYPDALAA